MHTIPTIPTFRGWMQTDMRNQRRPQWSLESSFVFLDGLETIEDLGKVVLANRGFDKRGLGLERMGLEATGTTSVWGKNKSFGKLRCVGIRQSKRNLEKDCRVCMLCSCVAAHVYLNLLFCLGCPHSTIMLKTSVFTLRLTLRQKKANVLNINAKFGKSAAPIVSVDRRFTKITVRKTFQKTQAVKPVFNLSQKLCSKLSIDEKPNFKKNHQRCFGKMDAWRVDTPRLHIWTMGYHLQ